MWYTIHVATQLCTTQPQEVEPTMYEPKVHSEQTELLMQAVLQLRTTEDAYRFFEDLCTIAEMKSMAQRMEVAALLRRKETYQEIAGRTGASTATISRVNRALTYGADGYNRVLDSLERAALSAPDTGSEA